jgi:hypothetical protein
MRILLYRRRKRSPCQRANNMSVALESITSYLCRGMVTGPKVFFINWRLLLQLCFGRAEHKSRPEYVFLYVSGSSLTPLQRMTVHTSGETYICSGPQGALMIDRHYGTITSMGSHSAPPGQLSFEADAILGIARFALEQYRECEMNP